MKLQNLLAVATCLSTCVFVCWTAGDPQPQDNQDATEIVDNDEWSVSSPDELDQSNGPDSEMSPDHWGSSASLNNPDSYRSEKTEQAWDRSLENHPWINSDGMTKEDLAVMNGETFKSREDADQPTDQVATSESPKSQDSPQSQTDAPRRSRAMPVRSSKDDIAVPLPPSSRERVTSPRATEPSPVPTPPSTSTPKKLPGVGAKKSPAPKKPANKVAPPSGQPAFAPKTSFPAYREVEPAPKDLPPMEAQNSNEVTWYPEGRTESHRGRFGSRWREAGFNSETIISEDYGSPRSGFRSREWNSRSPESVRYRPRIWERLFGGSEGFQGEFIENDSQPRFRNRRRVRPFDLGDTAPVTMQTSRMERVQERGFSQERPFKERTRKFDIRPFADETYPVEAVWDESNVRDERATEDASPISKFGRGSHFQNASFRSRFNTDSGPWQEGEAEISDVAEATNFRPDLGHRAFHPTQRAGCGPEDCGQSFGYEKEEFPPLREILATGTYFGSADMMIIKPHFQGNTAIAVSSGVIAPFNFDHELAPAFQFGFESQYGPGVRIDYFQFDQNSAVSSFTSDGVTTGTTSAWMMGPSSWSRITAANAGETLNVDHSLETHLFGAEFYKDIKFRRARMSGSFGFQYASILQELEAVLTNGGGAEIGRLSHSTDMRAYGPSAGFEYFRPIGHTQLEFVTDFGAAFLFGNRDQFVQNSATGDFSRLGADEFINVFDLSTGVQSHRCLGENRSVFWKVAYVTQTWFNGGSAINSDADFGFRGISLSIGMNR